MVYIVVGGSLVIAGYLLCYFTMGGRNERTVNTLEPSKRIRATIRQNDFSSPIAGIDKERLGFDKKTGLFNPISTKGAKGSGVKK